MSSPIHNLIIFSVAAGLVAGSVAMMARGADEPASQPSTQPAMPAVGTAAPDFSLQTNADKPAKLSDYSGKLLVLYFYPRADTPGCTKEACGFRDAMAEYEKAGIAVVGISPDPVVAIEKFTDKYQLNFTLLADPDHSTCAAYGVWRQKTMAGKTFFGVARTTFVIGKDRKILHVFQNVRPDGHDREVLDWLKSNAS